MKKKRTVVQTGDNSQKNGINTEEEALEEIKYNAMKFPLLPKKLKTAKVCLAAVQKLGFMLQYVPNKLKTEKLSNIAVQYWGGSLEYVPQKFKTAELCLAAVQDYGLALKYVPNKLKTAELCLLAVQIKGTALEYVPEKLKTPELCLIAVKKYWRALKFVPSKYKNKELCLIAVNKENIALAFVPNEFLEKDPDFAGVLKILENITNDQTNSAELCLSAEQQSDNSLINVPENYKITLLQNPEIRSADGQSGNNAGFRSDKHRTVILKPVFSSKDFGDDLIFINCTLGYDGHINLLFADKEYDCQEVPRFPQNYRMIIPEKNKVIELNNKKIYYTMGLQFDENKYCLICAATSNNAKDHLDKKCHIFNFSGKKINEFYIGIGAKSIQTASKNKIFISYDDDGFLKNENDFSGSALVCINDDGEVIRRYSGLGMIECESFNVVSDTNLIINTYPAERPYSYAFAQITRDAMEKYIGCRSSVEYFAVLDNIMLTADPDFFNIVPKYSLIKIDNPDQILDSFEFFCANGERLNCVHAQKDTMYIWKNHMLYKVSIDELL